MDQLTAMKLFARVVDTGSFSAVAREMNMGQPAVSKQISALEQKLGVRLLNRSSRQLVLTEAGSAYYERCHGILADLEEAETTVTSLGGTPRGRLRVNMSVAFGRLHIAPFMPEFLERYPEISIDLMMNDRFVDLVAERVDLAIRIGDLEDSSLLARRLGVSPMVVVGAPSYFEKYGFPEHPEDLKEHNCLTYTFLRSGNNWRFKKGKEEISVPVRGNCQSDNTDGIRDIMIAGTGLALVPAWLVRCELAHGELVTVLNDFLPWESPIHAVYPESKYVPLKVRCFIDFLAEKFAEDELFTRKWGSEYKCDL
ncbi:MAG: LysR family transcriptional regulator [Desulfuromonas sp.]|nr:MAG: LysR family transcriptional regulator [Desulfuromonas sp.]